MTSTRGQLIRSNDGTEIWAESAGDPCKPAVVFIPGFTCTTVAFEKQFTDKRLLQALHMVTYDRRRHGRSGKPKDAEAYESFRNAEDFLVVCEAFNLTKPFVAGWSLGSIIPVDIAASYGLRRMSGIIYFGGSLWRGIYPEIATQWMLDLLPSLFAPDVPTWLHAVPELVDGFIADPASLPYKTKLAWLGGATEQPPAIGLLVAQRTQDETRFLDEGTKALPVLLIHGTEDKIIDGIKLTKKAREIFKNVDVKLLKGVGHSPRFERPEEVDEAILNFVDIVTV